MSKQPFETLKVSEIKKGDGNYDWSLYVDKWGKILGLEDLPITILFESKENAAKRNFKRVVPMANIGWNPITKAWQIKYKYPQEKLALIHELGHLYLGVQLNDLDFSRPTLLEKNDFMRLFNVLNDQFVNYRLSKFPEFYELLKERFLKYLQYHKIPTNKNVFHYLNLYFYAFLEFQGIITRSQLKNDDKTRFNLLLKKIKNHVLERYKNEKVPFSQQDFQKLENQLKKFNTVKDTTDSNIVKLFNCNVLLKTKLWSKQELKKEVNSIYPKPINKKLN